MIWRLQKAFGANSQFDIAAARIGGQTVDPCGSPNRGHFASIDLKANFRIPGQHRRTSGGLCGSFPVEFRSAIVFSTPGMAESEFYCANHRVSCKCQQPPGWKIHGFFRWKMPFAVFRSGSGVSEYKIERGEKTPTPKISALLRKRPVLLRANFVLTKDRKRPYYGHFCGKMHREGSCSKAAGGP